MQSGLSRRYFLSSLGALSAAALLPRAAQAVFADGDRCTNSGSTLIVNRGYWIDSLGGPGGYTDDISTPLSQTALADAVKSGLSAVNVTVGGVGSYARNYDETIKNISYWSAEIAKHSDHALLNMGRAIVFRELLLPHDVDKVEDTSHIRSEMLGALANSEGMEDTSVGIKDSFADLINVFVVVEIIFLFEFRSQLQCFCNHAKPRQKLAIGSKGNITKGGKNMWANCSVELNGIVKKRDDLLAKRGNLIFDSTSNVSKGTDTRNADGSLI